jgi:20S proteasome subunit alpha 7
MSSIGTGYDLSASTYSPDGRVFQIEYANKAVENSGTAIGLRCKDGVVFAVEKLITSKLHEPNSNNRIFTVDKHVGVTTAGLIADSRKIVKRARDEAADFRFKLNEPIPIKHLVDRVSGYIHAHTLYSAVRPFGFNIMFGSYSVQQGPSLYMIDPSGVYWGYVGCAVGKAKQAAKTEIEKLKTDELTCHEAVKEAAKMYVRKPSLHGLLPNTPLASL